MRRYPLILLAALLAVGALAQSKPNFTGTWVLDPMLSRFGKDQEPKKGTLTIAHQEPKIRIDVDSVSNSGSDSKYTLELTTDGTENTTTIAGQSCVSTVNWGTRTGERLIWVMKCDGPKGPVTSTRQMKLGSNGKILTTVLTVKDSKGTQKANEFYAAKSS